VQLQCFALKPKPRKFLKVLRSNTFKNFLLVHLIENCCKSPILEKLAKSALPILGFYSNKWFALRTIYPF
jgi:hypothetical protein